MSNGVPDDCDIADGTREAALAPERHRPDECPDRELPTATATAFRTSTSDLRQPAGLQRLGRGRARRMETDLPDERMTSPTATERHPRRVRHPRWRAGPRRDGMPAMGQGCAWYSRRRLLTLRTATATASADACYRFGQAQDLNQDTDLDLRTPAAVGLQRESASPTTGDIQFRPELRRDGNGGPDECETDCNGNGIVDAADIANGTEVDCNGNDVLDECELADGPSTDCDANGVLVTCEMAAGHRARTATRTAPPTCLRHRQRHQLDDCDLVSGTSQTDCNGNLEAWTPTTSPGLEGLQRQRHPRRVRLASHDGLDCNGTGDLPTRA